jgi:alpha-beta hydrolase superfamily lysophospholipase
MPTESTTERPVPQVWCADVLPGFEQSTLQGLSDAKGPVDAVLVRRLCPAQAADAPRRGVLYIHGYVDYFFQTHLADFYNDVGLHFYAVDLRRHGRALRPGQLANDVRDIDEFLQDVHAAIARLRGAEAMDWILLSGHSTGGLVAALYAHRGAHRAAVNAVFLNSPFLDMNLPQWQQAWVEPVLAALGGVFPTMRLPGLSRFYGRSLHLGERGAWQFDTAWKPLHGFPLHAGWFRAIHRAHAEVDAGLQIGCPCLLMHAQRSARPRTWTVDVFCTDIVLNVEDMVRLAPRLGSNVERVAVPGAVHDLVLSAAVPRQVVFDALRDWLRRLGVVGGP